MYYTKKKSSRLVIIDTEKGETKNLDGFNKQNAVCAKDPHSQRERRNTHKQFKEWKKDKKTFDA